MAVGASVTGTAPTARNKNYKRREIFKDEFN
jgi:hypothetical protein